MSDEHWERVRLLFDELIELDAGHRYARLALLSRTDPRLSDELRSLIDAHERAGDFLHVLGAPPAAPTLTAEPAPARVGAYTVLREIGRGGMGRVYLTHDARLDRHVALKILPGELRTDSERNTRFLVEARAAAALDHPNVATIYEIGETGDGGLFIAMAYYGEETLRDRLARGPTPLAEALGIAQQIAEGLGAAHERGIVHRDIKPENILITANGVAKIVDFGIAKIAGHAGTRTGHALGTPHYMAPEQVRGDPVDARADLWALGVVFHEMLAGERPWSGESPAAILHGVLYAPRGPLPDDVPQAVRAVIDRLLARDLDKRYASAAQVRDALRRIGRGEAGAATVADASAETAPAGDATVLPAPLTSFIGREREVARIDALLEHERLVTLTGPGGMGKTRLALHTAASQTRRFHGVHFVSLVPVTDPALVPQTIAQSLGLRDAGGGTHGERVIGHLRERRALLVLDNVEHVLGAAPFVAALLASCPGVAVLATSRAPLGIGGEHELPVPPLSVAAPEDMTTPGRLADPGDAVRLFVQRAQAVRPDFALTAENAATVARICQRLDGMPLAIELAAARTRLLPPRALLARLDQRLDVLRSDARDLPERHRTLREVIGWSHGLLGAPEQTFFRRLAVFAGGFTVGAAEALSASLGDAVDVLEPLTALVSHSLLRQDEQPDGEPRFTMLETIHAFARERLVEAGEDDSARRAHLALMLAMAEEAAPHLRGPDQVTWLDRLERDHDNLRGALEYALARGHVDDAGRLGEALVRFWIARGFLTEGRGHMARILAATGHTGNPQARARLLVSYGVMTNMQGAPAEAAPGFEEALRIFREAGDERLVALTLNHLSWSFYLTGETERAIALAEEALAVHERFGDVRGIALAHNNLGWIRFYHRGALAEAREHYEIALRAQRSLGDARGVAFMATTLAALEVWLGDIDRARTLSQEAVASAVRAADPIYRAIMNLWCAVISYESLGSEDVVASVATWLPTLRAHAHLFATGLGLRTAGDLRCDAGDPASAEPLYAESAALSRRIGDAGSLGQVLTRQADARRQRGALGEAREALDEAFAIARRLGSRFLLPECLDVLARLRRDEGDGRAAARLFGAAARERAAIGAILPPRRRAPHAREIDSLREALGAEVFAEAWDEDEPVALLR